MKLIPLFFLCVQMFAFMNSRAIYYFIGNLRNIMKDKMENPQLKQVVYVDKSASTFIIYLVLSILYLFYCIFLMFDPLTKTQGCMLLLLSAWESSAVQGKISGASITTPQGITYPRVWVRYVTCGTTIYILLKLFHSL